MEFARAAWREKTSHSDKFCHLYGAVFCNTVSESPSERDSQGLDRIQGLFAGQQQRRGGGFGQKRRECSTPTGEKKGGGGQGG